MENFEGVHLGPTVDLDDLVAEQLENGLLRGRQDGRPADWLVRAWSEPTLSPALRQRLAASIHRALSHPNLNVVAEAVAALDGCPQMQDSAALNAFAAIDSQDAQDRLSTLFRQLRAQDSRDRGADLLRIILQHASLPSAIRLGRNLALSKEFGRATLAYLCRQDPDWVVANAARITAQDVDPDGQRMNILVFCFRNDRLRLLELQAPRAMDPLVFNHRPILEMVCLLACATMTVVVISALMGALVSTLTIELTDVLTMLLVGAASGLFTLNLWQYVRRHWAKISVGQHVTIQRLMGDVEVLPRTAVTDVLIYSMINLRVEIIVGFKDQDLLVARGLWAGKNLRAKAKQLAEVLGVPLRTRHSRLSSWAWSQFWGRGR